MANILGKNKALFLRKKGFSIGEIANKVSSPKSTISVWCRNIKLDKSQIKRLVDRQKSGSYKGRMKFLERIRRERQLQTKKLKEEGINDVGKISERDLFIAGISLYLSEGATANCNEDVSFTNSDPKAIIFMKKWFMDICKISPDRFNIQIRINQLHKNKIYSVERYWSKILDIPLNQFTKTILIKSKSKKVYPKNNIYYGTVRLKVKRGTQLRRKIEGWVEGLLKI